MSSDQWTAPSVTPTMPDSEEPFTAAVSQSASFVWGNQSHEAPTSWLLWPTANSTGTNPGEDLGVTTALLPAWVGFPLLAAAALGVAGNLVVVVVVSCSRRLHTPFYLVLMSLAIGDVLKALTVGPMAILRVVLGAAFPWWTCSLADRLYLGYACLTLAHILVALVHVHLALRSPLCFRRFPDACVVTAQLVAAWTLPIFLSVPQLVHTEPPHSATCRPLGTLYFTTRVLPVLVVPLLVALVASGLVTITINAQRRVARHVKTQEQKVHSDGSSNGFVTYENSITSEEGVIVSAGPQTANGHVVAPQQRDVIVHNTAGEGYNDAETKSGQGIVKAACHEDVSPRPGMDNQHHENPVVEEEANIATPQTSSEESSSVKMECEIRRSSTHDDDNLENKSSSPTDISTDETWAENPNTGDHHRTDALPTDGCQEVEASDHPQEDGVEAAVKSVEEEVENEAIEAVNEKATGSTMTCPGEVNVVHVKTKVGKEALNEPLDEDDIHLQLTAFLNCHPGLVTGGDNPAFTLEDHSDTPLSDSIKGWKLSEEFEHDKESPGSVLRQGLQVSTHESSSINSSSGISCTNSGHRSILKRKSSKCDNKKNVKFDLPSSEERQLASTRPRLLSCKYKMKRNNNVRGVQQIGRTAPGPLIDTGAILQEVKESLAKTADIHYLVHGQWNQGGRLTLCIKQQGSHARILFTMLMTFTVCVCPYVGMLIGLSLWHPTGDWTDSIISWLECLASLPFIIYPVIYFILSIEFRQRLKAMLFKN